MRQTGEGTNHEHTGAETLGGEVDDADLRGDRTKRLALVRGLAHLGDERVRRVGHDGADDTGEVTRREGDAELGGLAVRLLGGGEDVAVEHLDDVLEEEELGHCVRDLARPEGDERAEGVARLRLCPAHLLKCGAHGDGERARGARLDLDLRHLERAERDVGEELSGRGAREPDGALVVLRRLLAGEVHVRILEDLIETVLEHALERVPDEGGPETFPETRRALLGDDRPEATNKTLVLAGVDLQTRQHQVSPSANRTHLHVTFCNIEGSDTCVRGAARKDTTDHAVGVVLCVMRDGAEVSDERLSVLPFSSRRSRVRCSPCVPLSGGCEVGHG